MQRRTVRRGIVIAGLATLSLGLSVGMAAAGPNGKQIGKLAAKSCAKERKALGSKGFKALYGKRAMPNCIGVTKPEVREAIRNGSQECRAERAELGVDAFRDKYGNNKNKRNAFGKCVSGKRSKELREDRQDTVNAAKQCKAERNDPAFPDSHDGNTFQEFYGKNKNAKNAFGKCVSGKAKAAGADDEAGE